MGDTGGPMRKSKMLLNGLPNRNPKFKAPNPKQIQNSNDLMLNNYKTPSESFEFWI